MLRIIGLRLESERRPQKGSMFRRFKNAALWKNLRGYPRLIVFIWHAYISEDKMALRDLWCFLSGTLSLKISRNRIGASFCFLFDVFLRRLSKSLGSWQVYFKGALRTSSKFQIHQPILKSANSLSSQNLVLNLLFVNINFYIAIGLATFYLLISPGVKELSV